MEQEKNKKGLIIIIIAVLIIAILGGSIYLIKNHKENNNEPNTNNINNSNIDIQKHVNIENTDNDLTTYNIDLYNAVKELGKIDDLLHLGQYNITLEYKIKDYNIKLNLKNGPYDDVIAYDMYVNDTLIGNDGYVQRWAPYLTMYTLGDNIIDETHFHTDVNESFTIINKENDIIKSNYIGEITKTPGMIFKNINITSEGISLDGTLIYHDAVNYGEKYNICDGSDYSKKLEQLSDDLIVEAKYFYKYENGIINLTPQISNQVILKEYLKNNTNICS